MKKIKWGIIGLGTIAHSFAQAIQVVEDAELYAVASRTKNKAVEFGEKYTVDSERCYGSYEELMQDDEIDVIYIAVPHSLHKQVSIECLNHNKAVLCEKPATINQQELVEVLNVAKDNNCFYMEAMKTRFLPAVQKAKEIIKAGIIGDLKHMSADFGYYSPLDINNRLYNPDMGGGALLDVGVYPLSLALYLLGNDVKEVQHHQVIGKTKVDESTSFTIVFDNQLTAQLYCSLQTTTKRSAIIYGTKGNLEIPMFSKADCVEVLTHEGYKTYEFPHKVNGMEYEIKEVNHCLKEGCIESDIMSWKDSMSVMQIVDKMARKKHDE